MIDPLVFVFVIPTIIYCVIAVLIAVLLQPRPQAYCVKEKAKREITGAHTVVLKNGRRALQGNCKSCGITLFKMKSNGNLTVVTVMKWGTMLGARFRKIVYRPRPQAYCVKEKAKREITGARTVVLKNGRRALQGNCKSCGITLFKMM
ncbi:MAG: DUF5679 domain-containing protein [Nitrososphaerales archaeon]